MCREVSQIVAFYAVVGMMLGVVVGSHPRVRHCDGARLWSDGRSWRVACEEPSETPAPEPPQDYWWEGAERISLE